MKFCLDIDLKTKKCCPTFSEIEHIYERFKSSCNSRNILLKAPKSGRSSGKKNQENNKIILGYSQDSSIKITFIFYLFLVAINF